MILANGRTVEDPARLYVSLACATLVTTKPEIIPAIIIDFFIYYSVLIVCYFVLLMNYKHYLNISEILQFCYINKI